MTRNSKSNNDGAVFTYYERHVAKLGGTRHQRLPEASMKKWHHCALSLTTPRNAVVTPDGVIYDREAIIRHLIEQKKQAQNHKQKQTQKHVLTPTQKANEHSEHSKLVANSLISRDVATPVVSDVPNVGDKGSGTGPNNSPEQTQRLNFWLPGGRSVANGAYGGVDKLGVEVVGMKKCVGKRTGRTVCPVTGRRLQMRDLITLTLCRSPCRVASVHGDGKEDDRDLFVCAVCSTVLSNASKPVALRTGTVLCSRCNKQFVECRDVNSDGQHARDPVTLTEIDANKDVIVIHNHGTGFAGSAANDPSSRVASWYQPSMT